MSYRIRFQRSAKAELDQCCRVYACMGGALLAWLGTLAQEAELHEERLSFDIANLPAYLSRVVSPIESSWRATWERFQEATWTEDMKAILEIIKTRKPPWQLRASWRVFPVLGGASHCMPVVFFDVDHVGKQIVVRLFDGLPGQ